MLPVTNGAPVVQGDPLPGMEPSITRKTLVLAV
jgi:hypothetical protein